MESIVAEIMAKYNYWLYVVLMMIGLWATIAKNNLIKNQRYLGLFKVKSMGLRQ